MLRIKNILILIGILLLLFSTNVEAKYYYAILYANGAADLDALTVAQKESIVDRYVPQGVKDTQAWQNASDAQKWTWTKENVIPANFKRKIAKYGALPILWHETAGFEIFINWWKLAQEGTKFVFLVYLDYDKKIAPIKNWMDTQEGLEYWFGETAFDAFRSLWNDRAEQPATAIVKKVLRYPVETDDDGAPVAPGEGTGGETMITIQEAMDLGYDIEQSVILANANRVIPIKVFGK